MDPIKWVKDRTDERTSWDGTVLILLGIVIKQFMAMFK